MLDPGTRSYDIEALAEVHLNRRLRPSADYLGAGKAKKTPAELDPDTAARFSGRRAGTAALLAASFGPRMDADGLAPLYRDIEMPLMEVLAEMEMRGVRLDTDLLATISSELGRGMDELDGKIAESAGERFNINSPKQLAHILFEKIGPNHRARGRRAIPRTSTSSPGSRPGTNCPT